MACKDSYGIKFYCSSYLHPNRHVTLNVISDGKCAGPSVTVSLQSQFSDHSLALSLAPSFCHQKYLLSLPEHGDGALAVDREDRIPVVRRLRI